MRDVFTHCFRNSLDHGLESPEERKAKGKPEAGTLKLTVRKNEREYDLVLSDDGRGLNLGRLKEKGLKTGACRENATDQEISELIFQSGVSTAEKVTDISGRGVGMDAVRSFIQNAGGKIRIELTGEKTPDGFRPFQLVLSIPADWVRPAVKPSH